MSAHAVPLARQVVTWIDDAIAAAPAQGWLDDRRRAAAARLQAQGFPHRKIEAWRFTPVGRIVDQQYAAAAPVATTGEAPVRFSGGELHLDASAIAALGVHVMPLREAIDDPLVIEAFGALTEASSDRPLAFVDLNTVLFGAGVVIRVDGVVEQPLRVAIDNPANDQMCHPRILVVGTRGSDLKLVETYRASAGHGGFVNSVTEVWLQDGARLQHTRVVLGSPDSRHLGSLAVRQQRDSSYDSQVFTLGGSLSRLDLDVILDGPGAECRLDGLYVADGEDCVDHHTFIDHRQPHASSTESYRGIVGGQARAIFDGRVTIRPDAQGSSTEQENRNLLLSDGAVVHTKPSLIIDADDITASHGATVGQLDDEALYYLQSRGLAKDAARTMLIEAFALDVIQRVDDESTRSDLDEAVFVRLQSL